MSQLEKEKCDVCGQTHFMNAMMLWQYGIEPKQCYCKCHNGVDHRIPITEEIDGCGDLK